MSVKLSQHTILASSLSASLSGVHYFIEIDGGALLRAWYFYKNNRAPEYEAALC